jgi:hypothetical protein
MSTRYIAYAWFQEIKILINEDLQTKEAARKQQEAQNDPGLNMEFDKP